MGREYSKQWKRSRQPSKQRKYMYAAPLHIKGAMLRSTLSKALRQKFERRSLRVRTGDTVRVMRGTYRGKEGKVSGVNVKKQTVTIEKIERSKKDGSTALVPVKASNIMIMEIVEDKRRTDNTPAAQQGKKAAEAPASGDKK